MKRLFVVKHGRNAEYFSNKMTAKAYRDNLGGVEAGVHISKGPDHIGNHGHSVPRMRRQPK